MKKNDISYIRIFTGWLLLFLGIILLMLFLFMPEHASLMVSNIAGMLPIGSATELSTKYCIATIGIFSGTAIGAGFKSLTTQSHMEIFSKFEDSHPKDVIDFSPDTIERLRAGVGNVLNIFTWSFAGYVFFIFLIQSLLRNDLFYYAKSHVLQYPLFVKVIIIAYWSVIGSRMASSFIDRFTVIVDIENMEIQIGSNKPINMKEIVQWKIFFHGVDLSVHKVSKGRIGNVYSSLSTFFYISFLRLYNRVINTFKGTGVEIWTLNLNAEKKKIKARTVNLPESIILNDYLKKELC